MRTLRGLPHPSSWRGKGHVRARQRRRRPTRRPRTQHHPSLPCLPALPAWSDPLMRSCVYFQDAASSHWSSPLLAGHSPHSPSQPPHVNKPPASQRSDASLAYPDNIDYFMNRISAKWALITFNWPAANCSSNVFSSLISSSSFLQLHIVACIITWLPRHHHYWQQAGIRAATLSVKSSSESFFLFFFTSTLPLFVSQFLLLWKFNHRLRVSFMLYKTKTY